ncbi:hypothetical protein, partial [Tessaracoccus sp. OH4464_COT-324]|uniref:hypothetical protein n=1 Tax=Tessaracoccus sp. OH4464_COT-324 TaxID=2491059 RepID=UPI00131A3A93
KVVFGELHAGADRIGELAPAAQKAEQRIASVPLAQSDFGRVPWIQTRIWEAYQEHTASCREALRDMSETMGDVCEAVHVTAEVYESFEEAAEQAISEFFAGCF